MTLTTEQQNLLLFGNVSRDFSDYIYNPGTKTPPEGWTKLLSVDYFQDIEVKGLYFEIFSQNDTIMFVIRGTEIFDSSDLNTDLQMFTGNVPDQLKVIDQLYNSSIIQNILQDKRVIFTGNMMYS